MKNHIRNHRVLWHDGNIPAFTFRQFSFLRRQPEASLFRNCRYVRYLNRMLRRERATADTYRYWEQRSGLYRTLKESHTEAAKLLVNLIVANRGLPCTPHPLALSRTKVRSGIFLMFSRPLLHRIGRVWERYLFICYRRGLAMAPRGDQGALKHLQNLAGRNEIRLRESVKGSRGS